MILTSFGLKYRLKKGAKLTLKLFFFSIIVMIDFFLESIAFILVGSFLLAVGIFVLLTTPLWVPALFLFFAPCLIIFNAIII